MRRVLVVITTGFVSWGGLTNAFLNYYRSMDKDGLMIDIASMNVPEIELINEIKGNGGSYIRFPDKRKHTLRYLIEYKKRCKGYDVVHIHGNSATMAGELFLAKLSGVRVRISHCHTNQCMHPVLNTMCLPFFEKSYTKGLAVSYDAGIWLYRKKQFEVLHNVIDTHRYLYNEEKRRKMRKKYGINGDEYVIGHVGKIYEAKNHHFLVDVFYELIKRNYKLKLMFVGDGELKDDIYEKIKRLNLADKVIFTGMQDDTVDFYSAMDMFMFPSLYEGFGLALLEAQASGLECLASLNVPMECNVSRNVGYYPLDLNEWVNAFESRYNLNDDSRLVRSQNAIDEIVNKGYDSVKNARILRSIYMNN